MFTLKKLFNNSLILDFFYLITNSSIKLYLSELIEQRKNTKLFSFRKMRKKISCCHVSEAEIKYMKK